MPYGAKPYGILFPYIYLFSAVPPLVKCRVPSISALWNSLQRAVRAPVHGLDVTGVLACALFGCDTEESKAEGYKYLERAFELYPKWEENPDGEALEVGKELIFGVIKLIKGKGFIELPDGTREPIDYSEIFHPSAKQMYYGMTATHGWELFDPVREEERFKKYIERARILMENEK